MEIEFSRDEKNHRTHGGAAGIAARLAFGGLKQTVEGLEEAIGLPSLSPSHDAIEVVADHSGDLFHWRNFGSHHIATPLRQQGRNDIDLFAVEDVTQLFAVKPGTGGALGRDVGNQGIQIGTLTGGQAASVLEQRPAHPLQVGIGLLLGTAHLAHSRGGMGDDVELVKRDACVGQMVCDTLDKGGRHG